ncbi:MAG: HNH endonuclease signature motif containing protein [bacterium]|nr:HNH endonuclease signature motif containing protein [bacterium]
MPAGTGTGVADREALAGRAAGGPGDPAGGGVGPAGGPGDPADGAGGPPSEGGDVTAGPGWVDPRSRTVAEALACGESGLVGSSASVGGSGYVGCGGCGCGRPVCVGALDVGSVRVGELVDLMVDLGEARARLEGMLMSVAGEVARRSGWEAAAWLMREHNRVPSAQARADAGLAHTLAAEGLDDTLAALCAGEITLSHARVVARAAYKDHARPEADLLELGRAYPADVVGRHMVAHDRAAPADEGRGEDDKYGTGPAAEELRAQREARRARMHRGEDGMWHLSARFDSITGKRLHQLYQSALRSMRNRPGAAEHTWPQRAADAVAELLGGDGDCTRQQTTLLVLTDYDHPSGRLLDPRLDDGTPIPAEVAAELAVAAKVMPVLYDARWQNIAIGASRNPSDAQRMLLAARDRGCVGCAATVEETEAHHIRYWRHGGPTSLPNLTLLCHTCHDLVHERHYQVHTPPDGHPKLRPPDHHRLANPPPATNPILRN